MVSRFIPPAGPPRVLAIAQLTNSIGDGAYYVCSALYFTRIVGLSATQVGFGRSQQRARVGGDVHGVLP
jgi:hypothetical protein